MHPQKATFGFQLSKHAVIRLYERHPTIFADPLQTGEARWSSAYRVLDDSVEDKSFKNDTVFMLKLQEKYGYDADYKFFFNGDVLFAGQIQNGVKLIVTTLSISQHRLSRKKTFAVKKEERFGKDSAPVRYRKFGKN